MHFSTVANILAYGLIATTPLVAAEDTFHAKSGLVSRYIGGSANAAGALVQAKRNFGHLVGRVPEPHPEPQPEPQSSNSTGTGSSGSSNNNGVAATINVGQNGLAFTPSSVNAPPGSKVQFNFFPSNHSVVQGNANTPCSTTGQGFFSGFVASNQGTAGQQSFTVQVPSSGPMYFYCSVPGHCQAGMAGAINPPSSGSGSVSQFIANSQKTQQSVNPAAQPGQGGQLNAQNVNAGVPTNLGLTNSISGN